MPCINAFLIDYRRLLEALQVRGTVVKSGKASLEQTRGLALPAGLRGAPACRSAFDRGSRSLG
jgi:hypothetical protein